MAEIVADIASASNEQARGIEQVNKALTQMDEVTQQNSALVEENAATAKTLEHQAKAMDERVSFFKVNGTTENRPAAKPDPRASRVRPPLRYRRGPAAAPSRGPAAPKQPAAPRPSAPRRSKWRRTGPPYAGRARHRRQQRAGLERVLAAAVSRKGAMRPFGNERKPELINGRSESLW